MSRSPRARTAAAAVIGALIGALALAGCGAGQIAATANQVAAVGGANVTVGTIAIRDARIGFDGPVEAGTAYRVGGSAPLTMRIVNDGTAPDRLVSASSPVASAVTISGTREIAGGQVLVVEGEPAQQAARTTPSARPTTTATATAEPTDEAGEAPAVQEPEGENAEPTAAPGEAAAQIVLTGLREQVRPGLTYLVVLTFERAGEVRIEVPVSNPEEPRPAGAAEH